MAKETIQELRERARVEYGIINADQMEDKQLRDEIEAIDAQAESVEATPAKEVAADEVGDESQDGGDESEDLSKLSRKDLNERAVDAGIENPESYKNKKELLAALEASKA